MESYVNNACEISINQSIADHVKESCGIRSIARLLKISTNTVLSRIKTIADSITKPVITIGRKYEVDELKTYIKNKTNDYWVIYALDRENSHVVDLIVGKRNKRNIKRVTDTLLLSKCKRINTDRLDIYRNVIPQKLHSVRVYGTNRIERMNLNLRTHLKRLGRKTICYSKSLLMLEACLKIYFWY
jgi:IS1 family transposase